MASQPPLPNALAPGSTVAQRFTLQRLAGRGGMGLVFQARDEQTGLPVALKLLHTAGNSEAARRFTREARVLASLRHPGIVSYVAHGLTEDEQPFLVMEWLEGEDLARRLATRPLSFSESLQVLRRASEALVAAHSQGIIHRDLKPSNLFLRAGNPQDVVLLDFGLARVHAASQVLTGSAMILGTPGYMAPEQASCLHALSPGADIFSLGCVLYECLAGRAPFRAPHVAAVLAKILFTEPVPLRTVRPELPAPVHVLVEQMLAKEPGQRPADAGFLLHALEGLEPSLEQQPPAGSAAAPLLSEPADAEQRLVSVLLATPPSPASEVPTLGLEETAQARQRLQVLLQEIQGHCANTALLADGSLLATFFLERGTATDQAALAAHYALALRERWPDSLVALTTGLSLRGRPVPAGDAVDRAGELLQKARHMGPSSHVLVDDTTAGLLGSRFQLDKSPSSSPSGFFLLGGEHLSVDESRPLLGRPTPCVGREQELALLELAFTQCLEDSCACALLVTAPAGMGKSRLRHELLRRLERHARPPLVLLGRGDPMSASTAFGLVGQAVRRLCGVVDGEPLEARRARLVQRLSRHVSPDQRQETTEFLGELCATPFPSEDSPQLRAAREDPLLMNAQVTRALVTWLQAECTQGPVLWMLEDLHWSDGPSVKLVEQVLQQMAEQPLMVLALARPEVKKLFPTLWARRVQEVPLRGLTPKASARLVREVLGPQMPEATVAHLVGQAAGNALFLEELIRGVAEGHGEETPGSVLAMLQSRLQRLEPEARRGVLAASVFGRTFWAGGIRRLLEPAVSSEELAQGLGRLVELEVVQLQPGSRFPAEAEYRFHHALVRDAAYSLVPDSLRATWHLKAGEWLEAAGEPEPMVLGEHYKLGGQKQKALRFFTQACRQNCERQRSDLLGAKRCLQEAFACGPTGDALTELQVLEVDIGFWMDDFAHTIAVSHELLPKLAEGSAPWLQIIGGLVAMNTMSGRLQEAVALGQRLPGIEPAPQDVAAYSEALGFCCGMYQWTGQRSEALHLLERQAQLAARGPERNSFAVGWWGIAQGYFDFDYAPRPWRCLKLAEEAIEAFGKVGNGREQLIPRALLGQALAALGELPRAVEVLQEALARASYSGRSGVWHNLHAALVMSESPEPAHREQARRLALHEREASRTNHQHLGISTLALARAAMVQGAPSEAEAWAREACQLLSALPIYQILARTCLSTVLLSQGRVQESVMEAEQGVSVLERLSCEGTAAVGAWVALAAALQSQGGNAAAERPVRKALECLRQRARDLPDPATLARFLSHVPENARALHLARQLWGDDMGGGFVL